MGKKTVKNGREVDESLGETGRFRVLNYRELCPACKKRTLEKNRKALEKKLKKFSLRKISKETGIPKSTLKGVNNSTLKKTGGLC